MDLIELDAVEIRAIIDNELDPISPCPSEQIIQTGGFREIAPRAPLQHGDRRGQGFELRMDNICCSAHGLSLMITGIKDGQRRTMLFDAGPEESAWERNASRLRVDVGKIELVQLSHWHRDHSGGIPKALRMIHEARLAASSNNTTTIVDLHPARPKYRGVKAPEMPIVSLEPDPTFEEFEQSFGKVVTNDQPHTVLDDMFLVSGEIPRRTAYEKGINFGMRLDEDNDRWVPDELIRDERFLMCKVKGW